MGHPRAPSPTSGSWSPGPRSGAAIPGLRPLPPPPRPGIGAGFLIRDNIRHRRDIEDAYLAAIAGRAADHLANAYFLPGRRFRQACSARRRGVRHPAHGLDRPPAAAIRHPRALRPVPQRRRRADLRIPPQPSARQGGGGRWTLGHRRLVQHRPVQPAAGPEANVFVRDQNFAGPPQVAPGQAIAAGARRSPRRLGNAAPPATHPQLGRLRAGAPDDRHRRLRQPALNGEWKMGVGSGKNPHSTPLPPPTPHHAPPRLETKICPPDALRQRIAVPATPLVFLNGCFDILHRGHVTYLGQARALGAAMVVALNSDASVRRRASDDRPSTPRRPPGRDGRPRLRRSRHLVRRGHPIARILECQPDVLVRAATGPWSASSARPETSGAAPCTPSPSSTNARRRRCSTRSAGSERAGETTRMPSTPTPSLRRRVAMPAGHRPRPAGLRPDHRRRRGGNPGWLPADARAARRLTGLVTWWVTPCWGGGAGFLGGVALLIYPPVEAQTRCCERPGGGWRQGVVGMLAVLPGPNIKGALGRSRRPRPDDAFVKRSDQKRHAADERAGALSRTAPEQCSPPVPPASATTTPPPKVEGGSPRDAPGNSGWRAVSPRPRCGLEGPPYSGCLSGDDGQARHPGAPGRHWQADSSPDRGILRQAETMPPANLEPDSAFADAPGADRCRRMAALGLSGPDGTPTGFRETLRPRSRQRQPGSRAGSAVARALAAAVRAEGETDVFQPPTPRTGGHLLQPCRPRLAVRRGASGHGSWVALAGSRRRCQGWPTPQGDRLTARPMGRPSRGRHRAASEGCAVERPSWSETRSIARPSPGLTP